METSTVMQLLDMFISSPWYVKLPLLLFLLIYFLLFSLRFANEAEQGLKLRFGRVLRGKDGKPKIYHSGAVVIIPHIESFQTHLVRQQTIVLDPQEIILRDHTMWVVDATLVFIITDIYKAKFDVANLEGSLRNVAMVKLRTTLQSLDGFEELKDVEHVATELKASMGEQENEWGIKLILFSLKNCAPVGETGAVITSGKLVKARQEALQAAGITDPMIAAAVLGAPSVMAIGSNDRGPAQEVAAS